jgi:sulfide:quinone oxidoreductase
MKLQKLDDKLSVAAQIAPGDARTIAADGARTLINNRPDGEEPNQLSHDDARAEAETVGLAYLYQPVTTPTIDRAAIDAFADAVATSPGPVVAHCRSGTRCYVLWAASKVLRNGADPEQLIQEATGRGFDIAALRGVLDRAKSR